MTVGLATKSPPWTVVHEKNRCFAAPASKTGDMLDDWQHMKWKIVAIAALFLLSGCSREVTLEGQSWSYEKGVCTVGFKLRNHTNKHMERNVLILAHKFKDLGEGAVVDNITGQKIINVKLNPYEEKELKEALALFPNSRPDVVVVKEHGTK